MSQWWRPGTLVQVQRQRGGRVWYEWWNSWVRVLRRRISPQSLWPVWVQLTNWDVLTINEWMTDKLIFNWVFICAANPYPDVRRRYWNAYMLFYQKISDQNSPVLPKKSRVSIMRQEAEDLTLWVDTIFTSWTFYDHFNKLIIFLHTCPS